MVDQELFNCVFKTERTLLSGIINGDRLQRVSRPSSTSQVRGGMVHEPEPMAAGGRQLVADECTTPSSRDKQIIVSLT